MRGGHVLSGWLLLCMSAECAEHGMPFRAEVAADAALVRSGPGEQFYATGQLTRGESLEVHRRTSDGWLAIRPPLGSFCWVETSKLQMTEVPQVARAVGLDAVAWVGSERNEVSDHGWQVQLKPGEPVQVLGRATLTVFPGDQPREFFKIEPPAGEFRWIHESALKSLPTQASHTEKPEAQRAGFRVISSNVHERSNSSPDGFVARGSSRAKPAPQVVTHEQVERLPSTLPPSGEFDVWLKQLNVKMSLMAARPPREWNFALLRREAELLLDESENTLNRARARRLVEQAREFENLETRYGGLWGTDFAIDGDGDSELAEVGTEELEPRFDGKGWLLPVHSTKQAAPPYALLDDEGRILSFVSPAPGMNLHRYLRREVGVFGQRSRALFLDKGHLTAERIVDLNRHRR